ncbi:c6 transcription factor [Ophiostoma piceae UAMH 11346]|uniref:C6 transcription factor n=1 Tax=Ophiostoma piceae (strain UAMH 11346) TaxID=1262450 RepID=S3CEI7_OPHP1|nr:c6 transcription factor [Ophiostoma piceae UAMH 11346]
MQATTFRACQTCRTLKIKCEPTTTSAAGSSASPVHSGRSSHSSTLGRPPCRRCRDYGTLCVYTEPRRLKRKKTTDARVRELEREVEKLSELLMLRRRAAEGRLELPTEGEMSPTAPPAELPALTASRLPRAELPPPQSLPQAYICEASTVAGPAAAGIITMEQAVSLFRRFITTMAPQRPFVVFPPVTLSMGEVMTHEVERLIPSVAETVCKETPVLFLSIMTAAMGTGVQRPGDGFGPGTDYEALGTALDALLLRAYTEQIIHKGQKSVELVQALLISANWNFYYFDHTSGNSRHKEDAVPSRFDNLRFFQHLHMAAVMTVELESIRMTQGNASFGDVPLADPLAFERTLLACYMCCSSLSLGFHREPMLSFTPAMECYLKRLQTSPSAVSTDSVMIAWVELQRVVDTTAGVLELQATIGDAGGSKTSIDDASLTASYEKIPDLSDPVVQRNLKYVTRRLEQWRLDHSRCMTNSLLMQYNTVMCLLHESCFYGEFDPSDLKPPFRVSIPSAADGRDKASALTPAHLASRRVCLMAARSLIGVFLSAPTEQLLGSPVVVYARVGYSILLLLKLQISAALPGGAMNGILLDTATGDSATQIYHYLESTIARLEELFARGGHIAGVWLAIFKVLHTWYEAYFLPAATGAPISNSIGIGIDPVLVPLRQCLLSPTERKKHMKGHDNVSTQSPAGQDLAAIASGISTPLCSVLATLKPEDEEVFLSTALEAGDIDRWMDPRIGLGEIQSQLFEFAGL